MAKSKVSIGNKFDIKSLIIGVALGLFAGYATAQLFTTEAAKGGNGNGKLSGTFQWTVSPNPGEYASKVNYSVTSSAGQEVMLLHYTCSQNGRVVLEGFPYHTRTATFTSAVVKNADGTSTASGSIPMGPTAYWTGGPADCEIGIGNLSNNGTWQYTSKTTFTAVDN